MRSDDVALFEALAGPTLQRFGYPRGVARRSRQGASQGVLTIVEVDARRLRRGSLKRWRTITKKRNRREATDDRTEAIPAEPPEELRFRRKLRPRGVHARTVARAASCSATLAERDIRVRYKQAFLGAAWALMTPVVMMVVFTFIFRRVAKVDTGGVPYPLFAYIALLPWGFFSSSVSSGGSSILSNSSLMNKVYCPREVFPLYNIVVAGVDMACRGLVLLLLVPHHPASPLRITSFWVPLLFMVQLAFTDGRDAALLRLARVSAGSAPGDPASPAAGAVRDAHRLQHELHPRPSSGCCIRS